MSVSHNAKPRSSCCAFVSRDWIDLWEKQHPAVVSYNEKKQEKRKQLVSKLFMLFKSIITAVVHCFSTVSLKNQLEKKIKSKNKVRFSL